MFAFSTGDVAAFKKFAQDHERPLVGVLDANSNNKAYKNVKVIMPNGNCFGRGPRDLIVGRPLAILETDSN